MPGRFFLGVGTGENLNEHILGDKWPPADVRLEMLEEAVAVMRQLWQGGSQSFYGAYYDVENARVYDLPDEPVRVVMAAAGESAAQLAGRIGDGLISTTPNPETVQKFSAAADDDSRPRYGQLTVCWASTKEEAVETAFKWWPTAALKGELSRELPVPAHFEQAAQMVAREQVEQEVVCGPDAGVVLDKIEEFEKAGFTHVYIHQIGPDQEGFLGFARDELLPNRKT
jgi:G6PDH family F420-dependent oxidoreductase